MFSLVDAHIVTMISASNDSQIATKQATSTLKKLLTDHSGLCVLRMACKTVRTDYEGEMLEVIISINVFTL